MDLVETNQMGKDLNIENNIYINIYVYIPLYCFYKYLNTHLFTHLVYSHSMDLFSVDAIQRDSIIPSQ